MTDFDYYMRKAAVCQAAACVFEGGEPDLARFWHNAMLGFVEKARRTLRRNA